MDSENVKAIELNGIVHNATKIGVQDGDCEDLVNLRFKDGSWRASGDGKHVFSMQYQSDVANTNGLTYSQLYIHTNVYRHILGVRDGKLYWFGNIDADGVFEALDTPAELTTVSGDLYICQTGHLLTIIDDEKNFDYVIYKPADTLYKKLYVDENGSQTDRGIYPFGEIHFNYTDAGEDGLITEEKTDWEKWGKESHWGYNHRRIYINGGKIPDTETLHNEMVTVYGKLKEKNYFADPFLVCAAIKLYDGKYMYASTPVMIYPRQRPTNSTNRATYNEITVTDAKDIKTSLSTIDSNGTYVPHGYYLCKNVEQDATTIDGRAGGGQTIKGWVMKGLVDLTDENGFDDTNVDSDGAYQRKHARLAGNDTSGVFRNGVGTYSWYRSESLSGEHNLNWQGYWNFEVQGVNLCVHFDSDFVRIMQDNKDVFQSLCIFVTPQVHIYDMDKHSDDVRVSLDLSDTVTLKVGTTITENVRCAVANASYMPTRRTDEEIRYDLLHSNFFLLREYTLEELPDLLSDPTVDLQDVKYDGLLDNITQQNALTVEASSRYSYIPKAQYNYNGRLHIANYTQTQFHGYPLDVFHLNNHSLKFSSGEQFKGKLDNVESFYDDTLSEPRTQYSLRGAFATSSTGESVLKNAVSAYVTTEIETTNGVQKVCRYIPLGSTNTTDFIEQLDPLIAFPDSRAKKMTVSICSFIPAISTMPARAITYSQTFKLTRHTVLNAAYYMTEDLMPAVLDSTSSTDYLSVFKKHTAPAEERVTEDYPNGLKVSSTNNPLYFPVENTYQVGSSEIVAMMSNSVAVGTGQTGSAPLYIFCKDGVYAMFVDEEGNMAYTNSRVLARDVCNNAKSVTPIDSGVVFTTDRGLMEIAGEQVEEIGQPLEGDWAKFTTAGSIDYSKIAKNAYYMKRIAAMPDENDTTKDSMTQTDFLSYLKDSIINYNHNEFELMVSNPNYNYTYILDKKGNWSRRDVRAEEYVNNYPTSYRVDNSEWYQVDKESDADNGIYIMSHILKLDSIGFKELHRVVARGFWETISKKEYKTVVIPESSKTVELSPATAAIDSWQASVSATSYTKTLSGQLYRLDIPASTFERELVCELKEQTISFKCVDGCSIDTDKKNNIEITYKLYHDYEVIDEEAIDNYDVTENEMTITTPSFSLSNELEVGKDYYIIIAVSGTINLKGDNTLLTVEFDFDRYIYGDNTCPLAATGKSTTLVDSHPVFGYTIGTKATELYFDMPDVPEDYKEESESKATYLVIPEGDAGELTINYSSAEREIVVKPNASSTDPRIISNYTSGSVTTDVDKPTFALQLIKEADDGSVEVVYEKAINFIGFGNDTDTGTTYTVDSSTSYTVYSHLRVGIVGEAKTIALSAGKYRQRIVSTTIYAAGKVAVIEGCEFPITYGCKVTSDKQESAKYDYGDFSQDNIESTIIESGDTDKLVGVDKTMVLPMKITYNNSPKYIVYKYDTDGNVIGFTIPDGMSASVAMKFIQGDEGLRSTLTAYQDSTTIALHDTYSSSAGNLTHRLIDSNGNIVWSDYDSAGSIDENNTCECYYSIKSVAEQGTVTVELPAGTYRMEVVVADVELCMAKEATPTFRYLMDYYIETELSAGYTRNTYGMSALTIPDITQTTILTIPEHTETIEDTDNIYDSILGLYVFGSYDGRKWALLGHREKNGNFRDIGALVERTDCRFFRFVLAGQVSKDSRFDYFEVSCRKSKLDGKIR